MSYYVTICLVTQSISRSESDNLLSVLSVLYCSAITVTVTVTVTTTSLPNYELCNYDLLILILLLILITDT